MKKNWRQYDGNYLWKEDKIIEESNFMLYKSLIFKFAIINMYYFCNQENKKHEKDHQ